MNRSIASRISSLCRLPPLRAIAASWPRCRLVRYICVRITWPTFGVYIRIIHHPSNSTHWHQPPLLSPRAWVDESPIHSAQINRHLRLSARRCSDCTARGLAPPWLGPRPRLTPNRKTRSEGSVESADGASHSCAASLVAGQSAADRLQTHGPHQPPYPVPARCSLDRGCVFQEPRHDGARERAAFGGSPSPSSSVRWSRCRSA